MKFVGETLGLRGRGHPTGTLNLDLLADELLPSGSGAAPQLKDERGRLSS